MTTQHQDHQDLEPGLRDIPLTVENFPRLPFLAFIRFYQKVLSPGLPTGTCRFEPTCSHYGYQAIAKFGIIKGGAMAVWRILRCQPLNPGGYDPVP